MCQRERGRKDPEISLLKSNVLLLPFLLKKGFIYEICFENESRLVTTFSSFLSLLHNNEYP